MRLDFIPRKQIVTAFQDGWRLLPGHEYAPGDFAILMQIPEQPAPMTARMIQAAAAKFLPKPQISNKRCAAKSRNWSRYHRRSVEA